MVCVQTKSIDILKDLYELDLLRYVSWHCQWADRLLSKNMHNMATFFKWMKLKVRFEVDAQITSDRWSCIQFHPNYELDLFHHHIDTIDRWIYYQALSLAPRAPAEVGSTSISVLTFPMARDQAKAPGWVLQISETVIFTTIHNSDCLRYDDSDFLEYDDEAQARPSHRPYVLFFGPPLIGVPMLDLLLLEALQDPTRNVRCQPSAEKCAQIAQSLWLRVLPS